MQSFSSRNCITTPALKSVRVLFVRSAARDLAAPYCRYFACDARTSGLPFLIRIFEAEHVHHLFRSSPAPNGYLRCSETPAKCLKWLGAGERYRLSPHQPNLSHPVLRVRQLKGRAVGSALTLLLTEIERLRTSVSDESARNRENSKRSACSVPPL
jgi:hypothetical protein